MNKAICYALVTLAITTPAKGQTYSTQQSIQPYRIDPNGAGYRYQYPDGNFVDVMPCGASVCIQSTAPGLDVPPIDPSQFRTPYGTYPEDFDDRW